MGNLSKTLLWPILFLVLQPKNHNHYGGVGVDMSMAAKENYAGSGIQIHFSARKQILSKMCKSRNDQCQAHYQQTKFQKVTCLFKVQRMKKDKEKEATRAMGLVPYFFCESIVLKIAGLRNPCIQQCAHIQQCSD